MKKKSYVGRLGALALMLTVITTCLLGGTMARYVTEVTGSATATVAAWSFKANHGGAELTTTTPIDLGDTSYDETTLKEGVIAPGASGKFTIEIDGSGSEVGIDYDVAIKASTTKPDASGTNLPDDLLFSTEEITASKPGVALNNLTIPTGNIDYSTTANDMKKDITIYWAWGFGENDTKTSNDNTYAGKTWALDITVTGKQIVPTSSNP
ncbi:hypothetical protein [uncultured Clostridium sp.]|uniref:hypothetical protein n=1 Tax=uncultured Clostridium sp. TaxID=59620 RepID=UPI0025E37CB3|nr:hypothetical protein [uncultured Clostridium sp.]